MLQSDVDGAAESLPGFAIKKSLNDDFNADASALDANRVRTDKLKDIPNVQAFRFCLGASLGANLRHLGDRLSDDRLIAPARGGFQVLGTDTWRRAI